MKINIKRIKVAFLLLLCVNANPVFADRYSDAVCDGGCGSGGNPLDFLVLLFLIGCWWVFAFETNTRRLWFTFVIGGLSLYAVINSGKFFVILLALILIGATILLWMPLFDDVEDKNSSDLKSNNEIKSKGLEKAEKVKESIKLAEQKSIKVKETSRVSNPIPPLDISVNKDYIKPSAVPQSDAINTLQVQKVKCPFCRGGIDMQTRTCIKCGTGFSTLPSLIFDDND